MVNNYKSINEAVRIGYSSTSVYKASYEGNLHK